MEVFGLVTARSGSKGIPDKNLKQIINHSLLEWSIKASLKTNLISKTFLSTDSADYAKLGKSYGATVPFLRPPELASDTAVDFDVVYHFLSNLKNLPDVIVHIRPTTPLRNPQIINEAIMTFNKLKNKISSLRSKTYQANGYVDVLNPEYILKERKLHGDKIFAFKTPVVTEVDSPADLEYLNWEVQQHRDLIKLVFGEE
jgi:N-acylneuraminate cytidylyltransferase